MCTRVVYLGPQGRVLTARSMDWVTDVGTNLWVLPAGMTRNGATGANALTWTSVHGSLVATGFDISTTDGINDAGLVVNALWLAESQYAASDDPRPSVSLSVWAQYLLDMFATVAEAVDALAADAFAVIAPQVPGRPELASIHLSLSDPTGDSAILEYLDGQLVIHHDRAYQVMTNSPPFDQQLAIDAYWQQIGGTTMLPGTNRAADRFVRAAFYIDAVPQVEDRDTATAAAFSVIRNASVPLGLTTPDQPNLSSTRWRTVADHKDRRYFFDSATSPSLVWVALDDLDLTAGAPAKRLDLVDAAFGSLTGDVSAEFETAEPFTFLGA